MARFPAVHAAAQLGQFAVGVPDCVANAPINRPTRAAVLNDCPRAIKAHMADFRFAGCRAMIYPAVDDEAAANAAAKRDVKNGIAPLPRSKQRFTKTRRVRVVINANRNAQKFKQPRPELKLRPAFDLMRATDFSDPPINRPAEADTDGANIFARGQLRNRRPNLLANARAAARLVHSATFAAKDFPVRIAKDQLQLRAADFDAKEHAAIKHREVLRLKRYKKQGNKHKIALHAEDFKYTTHMATIAIEAPDLLMKALSVDQKSLSRAALESLAAQAFAEGRLTHAEVAEVLGLSRWETDAFLKRKKAFRDSDPDEFADDLERLRKIT